MPRNIERDIREESRRRNQLLEIGFHLFARDGIETVSLNTIANEANVAISTLFNYYGNKPNFVVSISAKIWSDFWEDKRREMGQEKFNALNAYQLIETYCDYMIDLYLNNPELLKFSSNYKSYICKEMIGKKQVSVHLEALAPISEIFKEKYENAKIDGCIRTDIPMDELFTTTSITMISVAERYAMGIVWADNNNAIHENELRHLKDMILLWLKTGIKE